MLQKHFRYRDNLVIPINYEALLNDDEFLNMWSFRGLLRKHSTSRKIRAVEKTKGVIKLIENELGTL